MPAVVADLLNNQCSTLLTRLLLITRAHFSKSLESRFTLRWFSVLAGFSAVIGLNASSANGADIIRISGSSTVFPITKAAIQGYRTTAKGKSVELTSRNQAQ